MTNTKQDEQGKSKKQVTLYAIFGIIGDIIMYPIIILSLFSSLLMFFSKSESKPPQIFGYSMATVLSGSMNASGFYKGDTVITYHCPASELQVGDIIAFFFYKDSADYSVSLTKIADRDNPEKIEFNIDESFSKPNRASLDELDKKKIKVYFHQIITIFSDNGGTLFFETKGTSNLSPDSYKIREDYVVGRYVDTAVWLRKAFTFATTSIGMICFVVAPLSILALLQMLSIIEQIGNILTEKKVINRELPFDSEESIKANVGIEMDYSAKIYFYASSREEEREKVWNFLWLHLEDSKKVSEKAEYNLALKSKELLIIDVNKYFSFWIENTKSNKQKNKIVQYQNMVYAIEKMKTSKKGIKKVD